jgi:hypothetical protein
MRRYNFGLGLACLSLVMLKLHKLNQHFVIIEILFK